MSPRTRRFVAVTTRDRGRQRAAGARDGRAGPGGPEGQAGPANAAHRPATARHYSTLRRRQTTTKMTSSKRDCRRTCVDCVGDHNTAGTTVPSAAYFSPRRQPINLRKRASQGHALRRQRLQGVSWVADPFIHLCCIVKVCSRTLRHYGYSCATRRHITGRKYFPPHFQDGRTA